MRLIVTLKSEKYEQPVHSYGCIVEIDWSSHKVLRSIKIPTASFGSETGFMAPVVNGTCFIGDRLFIAAWNFIIELDYPTFQVTNAVSHPPMTDLHGITTDGRYLWVSSTGIDSVLCLDAQTFDLKWRWGGDAEILRFGAPRNRNPLQRLKRCLVGGKALDESTPFIEGEYRNVHKSTSPYHHHHLNDVYYHEGALYVTTKGWFDGERSAVIRLDPETREAEFFVEPGGFYGAHDGVFVDDRFYVTESARNGIAWRERNGSIHRRPLEPALYFLRGLHFTGETFLAGYSPLRESNMPTLIVEFDKNFEREISRMEIAGFYPDSKGTNIHGLSGVCGR